MAFEYCLMYLGASFLVWVVAALLNHWHMCKDPDNLTVPGFLVFILTIILAFLAFPATLLLTFGIESLLVQRLSGKDEESYKRGYYNGYHDCLDGRPYNSDMK